MEQLHQQGARAQDEQQIGQHRIRDGHEQALGQGRRQNLHRGAVESHALLPSVEAPEHTTVELGQEVGPARCDAVDEFSTSSASRAENALDSRTAFSANSIGRPRCAASARARAATSLTAFCSPGSALSPPPGFPSATG